MNPDSYQVTTGFKSYVSKPEITALAPAFLVKGSKNVLIDYGQRVVSRNGYQLYNQANNGGSGIDSSYEWDTSTGQEFSIRVHDGMIEFDWNGTYNLLKSNLASNFLQFAKVWDNTEKIDVLLWVLGDTNTYKWSGGVSKIASSTSTTVTKQGVLTGKTTIAFVAGTPGTIAATVTDSASGFLTAGFAAGDTLYVSGSAGNSRNFLIGSVAAGVITLVMKEVLVSEAAGPSITVHNGEPTWAAARFLMNNTLSTMGTVTISLANPAVVTFNSHGLVAGDIVQFTTTGSLPSALSASVDYYVISTGLTANTFEISATLGGSAISTNGESQSGVHTLAKKLQRAITYGGISYTYTGGELTDTLTGLVGFPTAAVGDPSWQTPLTLPNPPAIPSAFKADFIGVQLNQAILASSKSQDVYGSSTLDYTNFTVPGTRAPADPFHVTMDNYCTCIIPIDNLAQTTSSLMFGAGKNEFFQLSFQLSQDNTAELVRMIKLKTADGSGLISADAISPIKNSTAYISREPALDTLANVETLGKNTLPLSDPIKNDFDSYNFQNAHVKYWKRSIYVALPAEGLVLIYDLMRSLWQPPQTIPVSRLAIIDDWLYGHSSITNETYKLFSGTDDNGVFIPQVARFAYNNGGRRDRIKNMSSYWSDGYITTNATLIMKQYFGFDGLAGKKVMTIDGSDQDITNAVNVGNPLGNQPLGNVPLGGAEIDLLIGLSEGSSPLNRFWQIDTMNAIDYTEQFTEYEMNTLGGQFAIVAHGSDQWDAGTAPISHKK